MTKGFWIYFLTILNAALVSIVIAYNATTERLLAINEDLLNQPQRAEVPHDVPILVSQHPQTGEITVYVYALFPHKFAGICKQSPFGGAL